MLGKTSRPGPPMVGIPLAATLAAICLAGCSGQQANAPEAPHTDPSSIGRFVVVPAAAADNDGGREFWYAWRIDTQTGDLEFCTMDGGDPNPTEQHHNPGGLSCTSPVAAP